MDREEALKFLPAGREGIPEWNRPRAAYLSASRKGVSDETAQLV